MINKIYGMPLTILSFDVVCMGSLVIIMGKQTSRRKI